MAPAIADYALIGDCRTAALVSRDGSIDWLCLPNFSSTSVFARLLDPPGGSFSLHPTQPFTSTRRYVEGTAVLETTFETEGGLARIFDCLPVVDGIRQMRPMREVLRIVEGVRGTISFHASIDPRPDYARLAPRPKPRSRLGWSYAWRNEILNVQTDIELAPENSTVCGTFSVAPVQRRYFSLSYCQSEPAVIPPLGGIADERLESTVAWWQGWSSQIKYDGLHRDAVVRSAVTLKLLCFAPSGAVVAAPTTSLPEAIGSGRNWDYRYCWLRDVGLTMQAMIETYALICQRLGQDGLLQRYESGVNGLSGNEGAFGICTFWALEQVAQRGELAQAERQFGHLLSFGNDLGLFADEIDSRSGEALGNFPQAFTHVGLINVAIAIEKARCSQANGRRPK